MAECKKKELRLVLVGRTGEGKSSSGNTILGKWVFSVGDGHSSVTAVCSKERGQVFDRMVSVVDTPGILDTSQGKDKLQREISKCINMSTPGPHGVLLVVEFGRFSKKKRDAVMKVEEIFGKEVWKYTIILFTHGDKIVSDFDEMLKKASDHLQEVLKKAGNRYHVFNNLKADDRQQVQGLLEKVLKMVDNNGGEFFSNDKYKNTVKMLDQREKDLKELCEKNLNNRIIAVTAKYEEQQNQATEKQKVQKQLESELEEVKRFYNNLKSGVRLNLEKFTKDEDYDEFLKNFPQL